MRALASGCRCRASPPADQLLTCAGTILSWCCCCGSSTPWKHRSLRSICQHFTCEPHHLRNQARNGIAKPRALRLRLIVELVKVESPDVRKATAAIFSDCIAPLLFGGAGDARGLREDGVEPRELPEELAPPPPPVVAPDG